MDKILQKHAAGENHSNLTKLLEAKLDKAEPHGLTLPTVSILAGPITLVVVWVILSILVSKKMRILSNEKEYEINNLSEIPCKTCQFFSNNHYLKCAVNPTIVLTKSAKNCSDYCFQKGKSPNTRRCDRIMH